MSGSPEGLVLLLREHVRYEYMPAMAREAMDQAADLIERYAKALREIAFLRPGGPCRNKMIEQMERIALTALDPPSTLSNKAEGEG